VDARNRDIGRYDEQAHAVGELPNREGWGIATLVHEAMQRVKWQFRVLLIPLLLAAADAVLRRQSRLLWSNTQHLAWLLSILLGALTWFALTVVLGRARRRSPALGVTLLAIASVAGALWVGSSLVYFTQFGQYPTSADLAFLIEESGNLEGTLGLFAPWLNLPVLGAMAIAAAATYLWMAASLREMPELRLSRAAIAGAAALALTVLRVALGNAETPSPPDVNLLVSGGELGWSYATRTKGAYRAGKRPSVPALGRSAAPLNVVFVIEESLGRARMSLYGHHRRTTPELERWLLEEPEALAVFSRGYTNSGNTSVVLPELLTGLPPSASLDALHSAPFLWQLAAAAGYRTLLLSAQSFRSAAFSDYFLSTPPERVFTADKAGAELVNGGGMDDRIFAGHVQKELAAALSDTRPFFAVVQYNATHHPILRLPPAAPEFAGEASELRYDNAVVLLDRLIAALVRQLRERGALERTVIVITSDHGENQGQHGRHRTQSYYEEVLAIPIIVYAPAQLRSERPDAVEALRKNRHLNVQNLDLPKTVLDALGLLERPELATFVAAMGGQSLFSELSPERVLCALNNTAARHWTNEGFAFVHGNHKYMFSERGGHEYYDLVRDPGEKRNLWPELRIPPAWVANALGAQPAYAKLLAAHARAGDPLRMSLEKVSLR
jgi:hypothetical protein